jgi:hypothetical protein
MYRKFTILLAIVAASVTLAQAQSNSNSYSHGQQDPAPKAKVMKVYPNPATDRINFEILDNGDNNGGSYEIIVYNFLGKRLNDIKGITANISTLSLDKYYSGIYIYQLRDKKGNLVESGKFNVVRQ